MNIKLVYRETNFNLDIMEDTPSQYLYRVAQKVFRRKQEDLILFYGKIKIENDSRLLFDVMGKEDKEDIQDEEIIIVKIRKELNENDTKLKLKSLKGTNNKNNSNSGKLPYIVGSGFENEVRRNKNKKLPIKCQICSHKNSIFYCRDCNMFICFECNIRYTEHHRHKRINLEDGDTKLGIQTYKEKILGELKLIDSGYKKFSKWVISNIDRDNFLQSTFKLLDKIKRYSQRLSDINTLYNLDQDMINNLKVEVEQTKIPFAQEELVDIFSVLNSKDKEIENYIKCVDLQIIKTEYNKVLVNCISNAQKYFKKIIEDVESKLSECDDMKFWGITEVKLYLKDHKVEKFNYDIFNNKEENKNNDKNNDKKDDSSDSSSSSKNNKNNSSEDEELKKFKMNLNLNTEELQPSGNISESKKNNEKDKYNEKYNDKYNDKSNDKYNETNVNITKKNTVIKLKKNIEISPIKKLKSPKKKNIIDTDIKNDNKNENKNDNKNDEKNNLNNKKEDEDISYSNTINTKYKGNNKFPNIKINKTLKNDDDFSLNKIEESEYKPQIKKKNLIRNLITNFSGDNIEKDIFINQRKTGKEYPLIFGKRNNNNESNEKIIDTKFKIFKNSRNYSKKLIHNLKIKSAKKD